MIRQMVQAFVDAKTKRADISVALYRIATDVGGPELIKKTAQRYRKAIEAMLQTASDTMSVPDRYAIEVMISAMSGAMRATLEAGASPALMRKLRVHLVLLCQTYMTAATRQNR